MSLDDTKYYEEGLKASEKYYSELRAQARDAGICIVECTVGENSLGGGKKEDIYFFNYYWKTPDGWGQTPDPRFESKLVDFLKHNPELRRLRVFVDRTPA